MNHDLPAGRQVHKDPTTYSIITYICVVAISISGGFCLPDGRRATI